MRNTIHCGNVNSGLEAKNFLTVVCEMISLHSSTPFFKKKLKR